MQKKNQLLKTIIMFLIIVFVFSFGIFKTQANVIWKETFSDVSGWVSGFNSPAGSRITSDGKVAYFHVENLDKSASFIPDPSLNQFVLFDPAGKDQYLMNMIILSNSSSPYNVSLDLFDADKNYLTTVKNIFPLSGYTRSTGSLNINLSGFYYDPKTVYVMPKINVLGGCPKDSLILKELSFFFTPAIWNANFSNVNDWKISSDPFGGSTFTSYGKIATLVVGSLNADVAIVPDTTKKQFASFSSTKKNQYSLNFTMQAVFGSASYDIALDLFDAGKNYISTIWNIFPTSGTSIATGKQSINLGAFNFDCFNKEVVYIMPKITAHSGATPASISISNISINFNPALWDANFSRVNGVNGWIVLYDPSGGSSITSDGKSAILYVNGGGTEATFIPNISQISPVPFDSDKKDQYTFCFSVHSLTTSVSYDFALDQFDANKNFIATIWNAFPASGSSTLTGIQSIGLGQFNFNANTAYIMPKIDVYTGNGAQTVKFNDISFHYTSGIWAGDFSDIKDWVVSYENATGVGQIISIGNLARLFVKNNGDCQAVFKPNISLKPYVNFDPQKKNRYTLNFVVNKLASLGDEEFLYEAECLHEKDAKPLYDIALDEYDYNKKLIGTVTCMESSMAKGLQSVNLNSFNFNPDTFYVMPRIIMHHTGLDVQIIDFSDFRIDFE